MYARGSSAVACGAVAVRDRLDERRAAAGARTLDRLARRLVDREHVAAVDAHAGDPVADRLVDERLRVRLRRDRRRDRPLVVVAEENERRLHHAGEVRALVERALARRAVAEERDRARALALQLLAPREPGGVRHLRRDRHADRARRCSRPGSTSRRDARATSCSTVAGRHAAQQPDRRLAVAREDPVLVVERVHGAGLHRLVVPEDRVRADAALPVVDDGALVVRAQQHHRAVELEQLLLAEAVDLAVLVDDPAELVLLVRDPGHSGRDRTRADDLVASEPGARSRGRSPDRSRATAAGSRGGRSAARAACERSAARPS